LQFGGSANDVQSESPQHCAQPAAQHFCVPVHALSCVHLSGAPAHASVVHGLLSLHWLTSVH
jgi:hypothetical protein